MLRESKNSSFKVSKFRDHLLSKPDAISATYSRHGEDSNDENFEPWRGNVSAATTSYYDVSSVEDAPYLMSPLINQPSPYAKSPWIIPPIYNPFEEDRSPKNGLIGSLVREEGHVYSLAISGDLLYTGSDSKNIRVWKNLKEFSGFKSNSGLVKAIVISADRVFTGHQDGKIRVWKLPVEDPRTHRRIGSLPSFKDFVKSSMNPKSYVKARRNKSVVRIRHFDAVSCLSLDEDLGLLYSGSWDKTMKVWSIAEFKCLESVSAHDDAVNAVAAASGSSGGLVFTGSADGTVKAWRRELHGKSTRHFLVTVLKEQESAVTSLAVNRLSGSVYCGSSDGLINFWEGIKHDLSHGGVLRGHKMAVLCLATGGNLVFSGSADKSICVWTRGRGRDHACLTVLTGHTGPVKCISVQEAGEEESHGEPDPCWTVYTGSLDRSVKVWRVHENLPDLKQYTTASLYSPANYSTPRRRY
ncbi:hypothetical protein SAY86_020944 [Trapa natans]|uniref:Uncharacterized protein n=1 Tax=Trapa natans TaxID=22666 RepID=A0AAN7M907_TRANT|nr:hypothetical protein SAY86_020944 [Trapa natans]